MSIEIIRAIGTPDDLAVIDVNHDVEFKDVRESLRRLVPDRDLIKTE